MLGPSDSSGSSNAGAYSCTRVLAASDCSLDCKSKTSPKGKKLFLNDHMALIHRRFYHQTSLNVVTLKS